MSNLLRFSDLVARNVVRNRTTLMRWIRDEGFPQPIRLGPNSVAWREEEIAAWLDSRRPTRPDPTRAETAARAGSAT